MKLQSSFVAVLAAQVPNCWPTAASTGLAAAGIQESSLTNQGSITYGTSYNGQTIRGKRFTGTVTVTGTNITLDGNLWDLPNSTTARGVMVRSGGSVTIRNSTLRSSNGCIYQMLFVDGSSSKLVVENSNISEAIDLVSLNGGNGHVFRGNYFHDSCEPNADAHKDVMEIYGGVNILVEKNTMLHPGMGTSGDGAENAVINIAPWAGSSYTDNITIQDNYIDGGHFSTEVDQQSTGYARRTRFLRNRFGGHTAMDGAWWILLNSDGRAQAQDEATLQANPDRILWPTGATDPNVNRYLYTVNSPFAQERWAKYPNLTSPSGREGAIVPFRTCGGC